MQSESSVPVIKLVAYGLWGKTALLMGAGWIAWLVDEDGLALLLGLTAGVVAPAAAVAHIKMYSVRVCTLIRVTSGLEECGARGPGSDLRAVVDRKGY